MKKKLIILACLISLFFIDRCFWMPERVKQIEKIWLLEKGRNLGDPLTFNHDFILNGSQIVFYNNKSEKEYPFVYKNRQSKFYLIGCYFGRLYFYDTNRNEIIIYFKK